MTGREIWKSPADLLELPDNEIHIWRASLNQPNFPYQEMEQILSEEERTRAEKFHFERDRRRFITGRAVLRIILASYLRLEPQLLKFIYGPQGKPSLEKSRSSLQFNLSHSEDMAIYGFTSNTEVGVDVESIRPIEEAENIAEKFFSAYENRIFRSLTPDERVTAFFNCWTRKEAYLKAVGDGLAQPLDRFDVSMRPGEPAKMLRINGDEQEAAGWFLKELEIAPGFAAALAIKGGDWQISYWDWENQ